VWRKTAVIGLLVASAAVVPPSASQADTPAPPALALAPATLRPLGKVDPDFQSYNVEMASVIGGRFWRPYRRQEVEADDAVAPTSGSFDELRSGAMFQQRAPLDLSNRRLRNLAAGLGPAYMRVSGTWANKVYFQRAGDPPNVAAPPGFDGVLTRKEWRGVVHFAHAAHAKLLISFTISPGVRDAQGVWTPDQARALLAYTRRLGGSVAAAEFFNEPNVASGGGAATDYSARDFARDHDVFVRFARREAPHMLIVGPSAAGDGQTVPGLKALSTESLLSAAPRPVVDVFSFHYYNGLSRRCAAMGATLQSRPADALSEAWLAHADAPTRAYEALRNRFAPGKPIWVTETADAACGGNPWAPTFLDVFRYVDWLGRYAQLGVSVVFHNTLLGSDYGLVEEDRLQPTPRYWAASLWRRLMSDTVLHPQAAPDGLRLYAHCLRNRSGGVALAAINLTAAAREISVPVRSIRYQLTADTLTARSVRLNGRILQLSPTDTVPSMSGDAVEAGVTFLPAHSVTFFEMRGAGNAACRL